MRYKYYLYLNARYRVDRSNDTVDVLDETRRHYEGFRPSLMFKDELSLLEAGAVECDFRGKPYGRPEPA